MARVFDSLSCDKTCLFRWGTNDLTREQGQSVPDDDRPESCSPIFVLGMEDKVSRKIRRVYFAIFLGNSLMKLFSGFFSGGLLCPSLPPIYLPFSQGIL